MPAELEAALADVLIDRERALQLLGKANLSNEVVASTLGCDPSYISQLMSEEDFREKVTAMRALALTANTERDAKADAIEDRILDRLQEQIEYIVRPSELLNAYRVVNAARRRGVASGEAQVINNNVVNLVLPGVVTSQFKTNGMNEVVEVSERPLITINSNTLLRQVATEHPDVEKRKELEKLSQSLPSAIREQLAVRDSIGDGRFPTRKDYAQAGVVRED